MKKLDVKELLSMSIEEREVAIFNALREIDCGEHIEKLTQNNITLSYLSWAWAFDTVQKLLPISYKVLNFADENGVLRPYMYDKSMGYMVRTEMTILGITKEMWLPILDGANKTLKSEPYNISFKTGATKTVAQATMFDANKTIMRCLVKNLSLFGLGLYIYAGEDLPEKPIEKVTQQQLDEIKKLNVRIDGVLKTYNISDISELSKDQAEFVITSKKQYLEKQAKENKQ